MSRQHKFLWVGIISTTVIALLLALLLPVLIKRQAIDWVAGNTSRKLTLEKVRFNPLTLSVELSGVRLSGPLGVDELMSFDRLRLALSLRSLYDRALILRQVTLDGPRLHLVRTGANSYNIDDLLAIANAPPKTPPTTSGEPSPLLYSVNNIEIHNGFIELIDRGLPLAKTHTLTDLNLSIPVIGNISYVVDLFVTPELRGVINGTPLLFQGKLKPFRDGAETTLEINLIGLDLGEYAAYYPGQLPLQVKSGKLDSALNLIYRVSTQRKPEIVISGDVALNQLELALADGSPLLRLRELQVSFDPSRPLDNDIRMHSLFIRAPELDLVRNRVGHWNLLSLSGEKAEQGSSPEQAGGAASHLSLKKMRLTEGSIRLVDLLPQPSFKTTFKDITVALDNFTNDGPDPASLVLKLASTFQENLTVNGSFSLQPIRADGRVDLTNIQLATYTPYLTTWLASPIAGGVNLGAAVQYDEQMGVRLTDGSVTVEQLLLPFTADDSLRLSHLELSGIKADLLAKRIDIGTFLLAGGDLKLSRTVEGSWSPLALLRQAPVGATEPPDAPETVPAYALSLGVLALQDWKLDLTDRSVPQIGRVRLRNINIDGTALQWPETTVGSARVSLRMGAKGDLLLTSAGRATPLRLAGSLRLRQFPLSDFAPYLPQTLNLVLADGTADSTLSYRLEQRGTQFAGSVRGGLGIRNLYLLDGSDATDLMQWESLQLDKIDLQLQPPVLNIDAIALNGFISRLIIDREGQLNFGKAFPPASAAEPAITGDNGTTATAAALPPVVKITEVTLQNGTVEFIDERMTPNFRAQMTALGGRIGGLSSSKESMADVDLRGSLANLSPLRIFGQINPLSADPYSDLTLTFNDIELAPISPYSGRYLGYAVSQGKLNLDLRYQIKNQRIESTNRIFVDQFFFGEKVDSPDATSLPVSLAVALLRDRKGEIHLDIPVTGRSDDPEFRIGSVVWGILKNLVVKAATSPMSLLSSMMGGGESFSAVQFSPGTATLSEIEAQKLSALAKLLLDRPALKLLVTGYVDPERDPEGYRRQELQSKIRRTRLLELTRRDSLPPGTTEATIVIPPEEYSRWLKATYSKEKFPKPRNFVGIAKDLPDAEMEKLILANIVVGPSELDQLAWTRGASVVSYLVEKALLPQERIFQKRSDGKKPPGVGDDWRGNCAEFGLVAD